MANVNFKQYTFKSVLLKQLFIAIAIAFAISVPLTGIPAYFAINHTINSDIENLEKESYHFINEHLNTGWQPYNVDKVYQELRERMPGAALFFCKKPHNLSTLKKMMSSTLQHPQLQRLNASSKRFKKTNV